MRALLRVKPADVKRLEAREAKAPKGGKGRDALDTPAAGHILKIVEFSRCLSNKARVGGKSCRTTNSVASKVISP